MHRWIPVLLTLIFLTPASGCAKRWDLLSEKERATLHRILAHWETWVPERKKNGTAPLLTFEELYQGLGEEECRFLDRIRAINPRKSFEFQGDYLGSPGEGVRFNRIEGQRYKKQGKREKLDPQYLPEKVYRAYQEMMKRMKKDLGRRLLVESGYRSPAYQLYTFLFYTPKHSYSLVETGHWVALPGYSEHGAPHRQAIDFINEEGINGEDSVEEFEKLPEYEWLLRNAKRFGFELSYPRGKRGVTFEPWHWRHMG
jgi:LAS superfamily LD-carboxypeptidase LdcB